MTRAKQKHDERMQVRGFLDAVGLEHVVLPPEERERPDFIVTIGARSVGLEVTRTLESAHPRPDGRGDPDERLALLIEHKTRKLWMYRSADCDEVWLLLVSDWSFASGFRDVDIRGRRVESAFDAVGSYCAATPEANGWASWLKPPRHAGTLALARDPFVRIPFDE